MFIKSIKKVLTVLLLVFVLCGCEKSYRVNENIKTDADNFKIRRRVVALNTRTNEPLFTVEGYISIKTDIENGDLNVTIQTGEDEFKLFYVHLSNDVTYTVIQLEPRKTNPYSYNISFFPAKEVILNGLFDAVSSEE
ncbi:MAG: hypothetical protein PUD31_07065 [Solobacterium sp.]|nr:hypothetical protein [Solobacterium sp.]